jgi:hypothetical protein
MHLRALLVLAGLSVLTLTPGYADNRSKSNNPNVRRAMKKSKKVRPAKYKAPKKSKKPAHATYGAR